MEYKILYQICRFPQNKGRYSVRKIIYMKNNDIKYEIYNYSERNLNKLYKEILKMNYEYQYFNNSNLQDINIPKKNYNEFKFD